MDREISLLFFLGIVVTVLTTGCGVDTSKYKLPEKQLDPRIEAEMNWWADTLRERGLPDHPMAEFNGSETRLAEVVANGSLGNAAGTCERSQGVRGHEHQMIDYSIIKIDEVMLVNAEDLRILVGHEMGHCWFGLEHSADPADAMAVSPKLPHGLTTEFERLKENLIHAVEVKVALPNG